MLQNFLSKDNHSPLAHVNPTVRQSLFHILCFVTAFFALGYAYGQDGVKVLRYFENEHLVKEEFTVRDTVSNILHGPFTSYFSNGRTEAKGNYRNNEQEGTWQYYYESGNLRMEGEYRRGNIVGMWKYYYENGNLSARGLLFDGKRQDTWTEYYESGQRKNEGKFLDGLKVGVWNYYYEDGKLKAQAIYNQGRGIYREFYTNGKTKSEGLNVNGRSDSTWTFYFEDGGVKSVGTYEHGVRQGPWTYYYDNGKVMAEGYYREGEPDGKWNYYYEDGTLNSEGALQMGRKEGFWKVYDRQGGYKAEGVFENGEGTYREYYESGKLRATGTIVEDQNEGKWTYFYEDGQLEGEYEFENGRGEFIGYYPDGTIKTKGIIEDGKWVGEWQLFDEKGDLAGIYRPVYTEEEPLFRVSAAPPTPELRGDFDKPDFRYRDRQFRYFKSRPNEFIGLVVEGNPLFLALGWIPVGVELFYQERLGYELEAGFIRSPFFSSQSGLGPGQQQAQGGYLAVRQKFYQPDQNYGMLYFAHELRYTYTNYYAYGMDSLGGRVEANGIGQRVEYSILGGSRFTTYTEFRGFTVDVYAGLGVGYRRVPLLNEPNSEVKAILPAANQGPLSLAFRFGINLGWVFSARSERRQN